MINLKGIHKSYAGQQVLKDVSFFVESGQILGLLGPNGAGKTTLMNILNGLISPDLGQLSIRGLDYQYGGDQIRRSIGYLPESPVFYPYLSAAEYLDFVGNLSGRNRGQIKKRVGEILEQVGLFRDRKKRIGTYSRGMKQRLGIGAALFSDPACLFLDEPASALDPLGRKEILDLLLTLKNDKKTIVVSSHILDDIDRIADQLCVIDRGCMLFSGKAENLRRSHLHSVFYMVFTPEADMAYAAGSLQDVSWIQNISVDKNEIRVAVEDPGIAHKEFPGLIGRINQPMIRFSEQSISLEDLFLDLIQNKSGEVES